MGLERWDTEARTEAKVKQEYDENKYRACLEHYRSEGPMDPERLRWFELASQDLSPESQVCVSRGDDLYVASAREGVEAYGDLLRQAMVAGLTDRGTVLELGAGYGYNLWLLRREAPNSRYVGGEYSRNAVALAEVMYQEIPNIEIVRFNFNEPASFSFLDSLEPPITVFTLHAVEQLQDSGTFLEELSRRRERIGTVIHVEPVWDLHCDSLMGIMRRRYAVMNDYNRDLWRRLSSDPEIEILDTRSDVFGFNPLHPVSVVRWCYRGSPEASDS